MEVWTVGHSTHPIDEFLPLLTARRIEALADVRRFPGSHRQPQFRQEALAEALAGAGIAYHWLPTLGGRRRPVPGSPPTGWRNDAFRGYADYLRTEEFAAGLAELVDIAGGLRTSIMCAEALWWRCHRRLIADVLVSVGIPVCHIMGTADSAHRLLSPARLDGGVLSFDG